MAMEALFLNIGKLVMGFSGILGPLVLYLLISGVRDQRESRLAAKVLSALNTPDLRGLYAVKIKCGPFRRDTAAIDIWNCSKEKVWEILMRLSTRLPSQVRLEVNGMTDSGPRAAWTLSIKKDHAVEPYCVCWR
jgi:hypothetical protein